MEFIEILPGFLRVTIRAERIGIDESKIKKDDVAPRLSSTLRQAPFILGQETFIVARFDGFLGGERCLGP
jgi:hypothetical protein